MQCSDLETTNVWFVQLTTRPRMIRRIFRDGLNGVYMGFGHRLSAKDRAECTATRTSISFSAQPRMLCRVHTEYRRFGKTTKRQSEAQ